MSTVEAVQAHLPDKGWILVPADEGFAPKYIFDEWVYHENPRVFETPNRKGKGYEYTRSEQAKMYILKGPAW